MTAKKMKIVEHFVNFKYLHVFALWSDDSNFTFSLFDCYFPVRIETVSFSHVEKYCTTIIITTNKCLELFPVWSINGAVAVREISEYEHACNILQLVPFAALRTHSRTCVCIYVTMNILAIHVRSYIAAICLSISQ